ncbi:WD40 repeat-like protein [Ceraceosorus guamensis]|uniref:WD40 repeat-like protein n=1 Tax=Ceraceosorus guamensis TaxID=1522189 RepID=A0A316VR17_9BASI|nr:WD40 repeat-like protein [Ceraceosorus guamensis]PWN40036.1 WD40 repeat-like protein [Ceraceosorus guamensis]
MSRVAHFPVPAGIPVYALDFLEEELVVYGGGGGVGRTGVTNALKVLRILKDDRKTEALHETKLSKDEDAPGCLAVERQSHQILAGINCPAEHVKAGRNEPVRIFDFSVTASTASEKDKVQAQITLSKAAAAKGLDIRDPESYIRAIALSPTGTHLSVGTSDGQHALLRYPSLESAWSDTSAKPESVQEIFDTDFSEDSAQVLVCAQRSIKVWATEAGKEGDEKGVGGGKTSSGAHAGRLVQTIQNPGLGGHSAALAAGNTSPQSAACTFRAAKFGRGDPVNGGTRHRLFTVVNSGSGGSGSKGKGKADRRSFVTSWDADSWDLVETRKISDKPVTVFDVSSDGTKLAYGSSDLSVGVLDARTLRPLVRILDAHGFPSTALKFSPSGRTLISASADNTLRVIDVPKDLKPDNGIGELFGSIIVAILLVLVAIWMHNRFDLL